MLQYRKRYELLQLVGFLKGDFAVQCSTAESAINFLSLLERNNITWIDGDNATYHTNLWYDYEGKTCFEFELDRNGIMYSDVEFCKQNNLPVVLF